MTCRHMFQTHRSHVQSSWDPDSPLKRKNFLENIFYKNIFFSLFFASSWPGEKLQASEKVKHVFISLVNIGHGGGARNVKDMFCQMGTIRLVVRTSYREEALNILYLYFIFSSLCKCTRACSSHHR